MDKLSKRIIQEFKAHGKTNFSCSYSPSSPSICDTTLSEFASAIGADKLTVKKAFQYLEKSGYLDAIGIVHPSAGKMTVGVQLSHKGLHYKEIVAEERRQILLKSMWIPFLVSVLTTLTVNALQQLWPLILRWLSSFLS